MREDSVGLKNASLIILETFVPRQAAASRLAFACATSEEGKPNGVKTKMAKEDPL